MDDSKYRYFLAAGKSLDTIRECERLRGQARIAAMAIADEFGARTFRYDERIRGFVFDTDDLVPPGWRRSLPKQDRHCWMPGRTNKALKALYERIHDIYIPGGMWVAKEFGAHEWCWTGDFEGGASVIRFPTYRIVGEDFIILMPVDHKGEFFSPPDAVPMPNSEYWLRIEAAEREKAA